MMRLTLTEHPAFAQARAEMAAELAAAHPPISETMRRFDAERALMREDPVLALLCRIEAIANRRAENHACDASNLATVRDLARQAIEARTGRPFANPIYP